VLTIWVCNFLAKGFLPKAAHKMLVKLTPAGILGEKMAPNQLSSILKD